MLEDEEDCASHEHQDHAALRWFVPHLTKCLGWHSSAYLMSYMFSIDHSAFTMSQFNDNKNSKIDDSEEGVPSVWLSVSGERWLVRALNSSLSKRSLWKPMAPMSYTWTEFEVALTTWSGLWCVLSESQWWWQPHQLKRELLLISNWIWQDL